MTSRNRRLCVKCVVPLRVLTVRVNRIQVLRCALVPLEMHSHSRAVCLENISNSINLIYFCLIL